MRYDVVVLGSGVLGLSIATHLHDAGLRVAIVARDLAEDVESQGFASPWAGASWQSWAITEREKQWDRSTYLYYLQLIKSRPDLVMRTPVKMLWNTPGAYPERWYKDLVDDYRLLERDEIPADRKHGVGFTALTVNAPHYIVYLSSELKRKGVPIIRKRVTGLNELYSLLGDVNLVVNASGLGSRTLLGVEDFTCFPKRGQTIVVRAPQVKTFMCDDTLHPEPTHSTYIIPRPGSDDLCVLGGVYEPRRWELQPEWDTAERILKQAFAWCPALANGGKSWKDIEIVSHNVGLRTGREAVMRLELEKREAGEDHRGLLPKLRRRGGRRDVAVIHAYGTNTGYMSHWGIAEEATELALDYLAKNPESERSRL